MTRPLVTYYGGKQRIGSHLLKMLPDHGVYVEPFAGGAALLFMKERSLVECLNDKNGLLFTMYKVAREDPEALKSRLELTPYSLKELDYAKRVCKSPIEYSELEIASSVVVQCRQSFAAKMYSGWGRSRNPERSHALEWARFQGEIPEILQRLRAVYIDAVDALDCIDRWDGPESLFYCDPPYPGSDQGHYAGYSMEDFARLVEKLKSIKGAFLLSAYSNVSPLIPADWERFEIATTMSAKMSKGVSRKDSARAEIVWRKCSGAQNQQLRLL